ncbi:MAG TPA: lysylphosphatidylglycerol synthase transmembrane domain-containing protein, partial [bacterium]
GNNVLPAHLGELVRTVVFARQYGHSSGAVLASLVLERVLDVFAILAFYFTVVQLGGPLPESIRAGAEIIALVMVPFCLGLFLFLRFPSPFMRLWAWGSAWLPQRLRERGTRLLDGIAHGLSAVESPGRVLALLLLSLVKWGVTGGMVWLALRAFHTPIGYNAAIIGVAVSALAVTLPSAPGYVGTLQAAFVFSLTPFGVSPEVSFAASVYYLVAQWIPVTAAGVLSFFLVGIQWKDLRREVEAVEKNPTGA